MMGSEPIHDRGAVIIIMLLGEQRKQKLREHD